MIHTTITADTRLRDARIAVEVAQAAHDKALMRGQTREQAKTLPKLYAALHALIVAEQRASNG